MYSYLGHLKANNFLRNNEAFYDRGTYYDVPYWTADNPLVYAPQWSWMDPENDSYTPSYISFKVNITL